jgi:DNA-binding response OmpR family regulator
MPTAPLILIVEDEPDLRMLLVAVAENYGYRVAGANERSTGAEIMRSLHPDLVIANVRLRGGNGNDLAKLAHAMNVPILLISGEPNAIEQHDGGAIPFLRKPFHLRDIEAAIERLIGKPA